ncbi:MAG: hypothetical protein J6S67_23995 [Methanobrevibacter sp.]|nr:hypothetical protein [Methanobrevibacter sp.]
MAKIGFITVKFENTIMEICDSHPTCEGCVFKRKYKGCYFRGKSPKEWHELRDAAGAFANGISRGIELSIQEHDKKSREHEI